MSLGKCYKDRYSSQIKISSNTFLIKISVWWIKITRPTENEECGEVHSVLIVKILRDIIIKSIYLKSYSIINGTRKNS